MSFNESKILEHAAGASKNNTDLTKDTEIRTNTQGTLTSLSNSKSILNFIGGKIMQLFKCLLKYTFCRPYERRGSAGCRDFICTSAAVYVCGLPLRITENKTFVNFLQYIRPSFKIPTRHKLANKLLDKEYSKVQDEVAEKLNSAVSFDLSLSCDGWTNIRKESIFN